MEGKKVIVTGGLGFIGSHLADRLVKDNEVVIIDDLSTGKLENVCHLNRGNLKVVIGSILDLDLAKLFRGSDYVFHQAALASVPRSINDPKSVNDVNISGTLKVLTAAHEAGVKKVVFASSSSVYGDTPVLPKSEGMPLNPMSPYAVTKATGELYCKVFQEIYGFPIVSLRYFNVFGPRQDPNSQYAAVIPRFIKAILGDMPPVVYGDGDQSRDFSYVRHIVDANVLACESERTGVFNVACGRCITVNQLVSMINEFLGKDIKPFYAAPRPGDIRHSIADISKARSIGYEPVSDFKAELMETVRWFKNATNDN